MNKMPPALAQPRPGIAGSADALGRVWRFGDDVDTDAMAPGAYMQFGVDRIAQHCLSSLRPEFPVEVAIGDIVVGGSNFGMGSSREQAPQALVRLGVRAVVAVSFAGLFYRNALNVGLAAVECPRAKEIADGVRARIDLAAGHFEIPATGVTLPCEPIPAFLLELLNDGGLIPNLRRRLRNGAFS
ncbi:MAG: 3-isopropylmalate dehydratase [Burkholderiales bacterium]|nr:3-isopropylmalate dehydratase [Burkholderiales bacterium]